MSNPIKWDTSIRSAVTINTSMMSVVYMILIMLTGHQLYFVVMNVAVERFQCIFSDICSKHAPLKKKRVRKKKAHWLTNDVVTLMCERDSLKKKAIKSGDSEDWSRFRSMKNKVNYEIRQSKRSFIWDSVQTNGNNTKEVRNTIRHVIPGKCNSTNIN